ncbi:sialin-like [Hetaerina americana]|uniref:sialin-like n=1 Tax=Hetaerina americana TaxID=62018 RepID=UPI003A7F395B
MSRSFLVTVPSRDREGEREVRLHLESMRMIHSWSRYANLRVVVLAAAEGDEAPSPCKSSEIEAASISGWNLFTKEQRPTRKEHGFVLICSGDALRDRGRRREVSPSSISDTLRHSPIAPGGRRRGTLYVRVIPTFPLHRLIPSLEAEFRSLLKRDSFCFLRRGRVSKGEATGSDGTGNPGKEEGGPLSNGCRRDEEGKRRVRCHYIPARVVLAIVSFFGFFMNQMLRVNINIAIVAMVNGSSHSPMVNNLTIGNESTDSGLLEGTCIQYSTKNNLFFNGTLEVINSTGIEEEGTEKGEVFNWDSIEQGMVIGALYWTYVISLVPGAMLANVIGPKLVFGGANLMSALLALLTPFAAKSGFNFLLLVRILQGLFSGVTWPTMNIMASRWIPPHERSKFISTYLGNAVGSSVAYPLFGALIDNYGWESSFYTPGVIACVWCVFWWLLAFDTPSAHPRISREEQVYIETAVSPSLNNGKMPTPWKKILLSIPFWALVASNLGSLWGFMTILSYGPTYLNNIHGFSMKANGIFSGLPNIMRFIFSIIYSSITDHIIRKKILSVTAVRKISTCIVELLPGMIFLLMTNIGCNAAAEVAILTLASGFTGATSSGPLANSIDLAPNFSGVILGLVNVVSMSTGFLIPTITGAIINNNNTMDGWRLVFIIGAVVSISCCLVFTIFGSGDVQEWNWPPGQAHRGREEGIGGEIGVREHSLVLEQDNQRLSNGKVNGEDKSDCVEHTRMIR